MRHIMRHAALKGLSRLPRRFWAREDGSTTVFATVVFVLMVGIGGIAIDVMRYETQRVQLQYTLDRAVLAAASLAQPLDPQRVVENYFETAGLEGYRLRVNVEQGVNFRRIEARAEMETQTLFMSLFGQPVLTSPAAGAAEERVRNVEVSLVLDISGSMNMWPTYRIDDLRPAARDFVSSVLEANDNPNNEQLVSVSLVPYNSNVNMGSTLSSVFALTNEHNISRCARFYWNDFTVSGLNPAVPLQRTGHIDWWATSMADPIIGRYTCPRNDRDAIVPWSHNETVLHNAIDSINPDGGTAIDMGLRWGVALLDPAAQPALSGLVGSGNVHPDFDGRPSAYSDVETLKILVLMTDGESSIQRDVRPGFRSGASRFWRDPDNGRISVFYPEFNQFWQVTNRVWSNTPDGGNNNNAIRLDYAQLWNHIPVQLIQNAFFNDSRAWAWPNGGRRTTIEAVRAQHGYWNVVEEFVDENEGDRRSRQMCDVAKADDNIIIFTIAFDAPARGQTLMRYCASSDAHYYDVDGIDISNAFASIAQTINRLRLVQ